ncbi:MAG: hypothetical protein O9295_04300 [Microcystis sp. LE18-22.4A]|uniref:hypothetical protein n=1 Tax=Microcystis sp. LE18-22.4A TaxID=3016432 RepID=UPI0022C99A43|nr:hypothetical protein [Microcystis sp. LE18-22.4A]MCZ8117296.1 hypothetical protein [Microcystis sp. LE18-22.4A]
MLFKQKFFLIVSFLIVVFCGFGLLNLTYDASVLAQEEYYQIRSLHSRDGIVKFYRLFVTLYAKSTDKMPR